MTLIYALKDPRTGQVRYVGKTNKPRAEDRLYEHILAARRNKGRDKKANWIRSLLRKGLKPIPEVLESCTSNWRDREKYWIAHFDDLCNITEGGEGTMEHRRRPIVKINPDDGMIVEVFASIDEAAKSLGKFHHAIRHNALRRSKISYGWVWRFVGDIEPPEEIIAFINKARKRGLKRYVGQYTPDGTLIATHDSITAAAKVGGVTTSTMWSRIKSEELRGGFYWRYML